jgi:hypothetical protein
VGKLRENRAVNQFAKQASGSSRGGEAWQQIPAQRRDANVVTPDGKEPSPTDESAELIQNE